MRLVRPSCDDIVRRCRYLIRQQRFRELCMTGPQIKALTYLQTEVSAVVDHSDAEETRVFRSLLSHLLVPSPFSVTKNEDTETTPVAPAKRRYSNEEDSPMKVSPEGSSADIGSQEGKMDKDEDMEESPSASEHKAPSEGVATTDAPRPVVSMEEDPIERELVGGKAPSAELYRERTAVFEQLMTFVNEDAKQPDKDLLKMIKVDEGDL
ncbi:hypothetical protein NM688_g7313 [Phlebia brevispora]|uniref:Uncharacterized protein n=1 Tax=Phlebia brevispora TaxID=194682 RepID=A0ACC1S761_9APHY|nr:hypothetical protein NM688_g7313 [Phlebia brevispora]